MRIGFVGSGNIGQALARLAKEAGYEVSLSNSRGPDSLLGLADLLGVQAATTEQAARESDLVVLAVPFIRVFDIDPVPFRNRVVLDTNNYYPMRDGCFEQLDEHRATTTGLVQRHLAGATVIKAFNAIMAPDLVPPFGLPGRRRALPVAADEQADLATVEQLHQRIGLDMVWAGSVADSWRFERAKPAYCVPLDREGLLAALARAERTVELPHNSWKRTA